MKDKKRWKRCRLSAEQISEQVGGWGSEQALAVWITKVIGFDKDGFPTEIICELWQCENPEAKRKHRYAKKLTERRYTVKC
jgi:hypothetical protein